MLSGIIVIDKPGGYTSHDVISVLRRIFKMRRIGHGGTLDPMATGVLPVFLGTAAKASGFALAHDKEYIVRFKLGISTDTQDITGNVLRRCAANASVKDVENALKAFTGKISQLPPMYSAVKKNGRKLYEYARRGITVERDARSITVYEAVLTGADEGSCEFEARVFCSSGTYIRTLCSDLGDMLSTGAAVTYLKRTKSGIFRLSDALPLDMVSQLKDSGGIERHILSSDVLFKDYPEFRLDSNGEARAKNGAFIPLPENYSDYSEGGLCRVYSPDGLFLMLGRFKLLNSGARAVFCEKNFFN